MSASAITCAEFRLNFFKWRVAYCRWKHDPNSIVQIITVAKTRTVV